MKVKELQKSVNVTWSPAQQYPILLAAGTAAQQLDTSTNAILEIYSANLTEPGYDLVLKGSQTSPYRFYKLVWSPLGIGGQYNNGVIVGGCENGNLQVYNADKLLAGEDALMSKQEKHTGPVRAIDFNPFQSNLLASGASESEILIWDLNNTNTPMTPGTKTQPFEDIQNVAWNKQVQHILASVFSSRCVVWDLRKNEPIIKLSDTQSRVRWRALQWHPDIATQLWLASEDDQAPVVQLWDLRYATSPAKTVQIHQRGILGLSWCPSDNNLMISCGKDNKIICWNPNSETQGDEIESEVATTIQWYSDVQWCPKNPALIASSSLDGNVSIYSLYGGTQQQVQTSNKIADSFPGMETFAQAPVPQNTATSTVYHDLRHPPVWMKRPVGASFGFGGKLISFNQSNNRSIQINQIVTETELVERSMKLEEVLANGNFVDFCRQKADETTDQNGRYIWYFLKANFEENPRAEMLNLLGYNSDDMKKKFGKPDQNEIDHLTDNMGNLSRSDSSEVDQSTDESIDISATVGVDNNAVFDEIAADHKSEEEAQKDIPFKIKTGDDNESLISQAILTGNCEAAVELCMDAGRPADAIIIALTGGAELLARTQFRYLKNSKGYLSNIISALVTGDWMGVVSQCTTDSWKEALAATLTHSNVQMSALCERLGERLQADPDTSKNAILCYICAGNVEKLVEAWPVQSIDSNIAAKKTINDLQDLIEIVMLLQKAVELQGRSVEASGKLADLLSRYAGLLTAQGALSSALTYLSPSDDPQIEDLRSRLYYSLGHKQPYGQQQSQYTQNGQLANARKSIPTHLQVFTAPNLQQPSFVQPGPVLNNIMPSQSQPQSQPWNIQPTPSSASWNTPVQPAQQLPPMIPSLPSLQSKPPAGPPAVNDGVTYPARPSSVGSQGSTPASRSKYVLDPSVQLNSTAYGQTSNIYTPQSTFNTHPIQQQPSYQNQYNPPQQSNAINNFSGISQPNQFVPFTPAPLLNQTPGSYVPGTQQIELAQQAMPQTIQQRNPTPPPGWNDPPALKTSRPAAPKQDNKNLYGGADVAHSMSNILDPSNHQCEQYQKGPPTMMTPLQPFQSQHQALQQSQFGDSPQLQQTLPGQPQQPQQHHHQFTEQMNFQTHPIRSQHQPQQQQSPMPPQPEPIKQKLPLPEEYVYMQTVFNELRQQCVNTATNPQTKRKFEDVSKRLDSLYDLLRENRLSSNTLTSLNQLVQLVQIGDYANGLGLHTQMVSGADFAQIASFMPGIKVLLQSAMQLQVYLR